jgi:hypothetical protein
LLPGRLLLSRGLFGGLLLTSSSISLFKDIEGQTLALLKDFVNKVLMALSGLEEVDDFLGVIVDMGTVIVSVLDGLLGCDELADVDGS